MDLRDYFQQAKSHLEVDWVVITPREGGQIDVGEEFDVQLSVRNSLQPNDLLSFKDIELVMAGSPFAEPAAGNRVPIPGKLQPGEVITHTVRFRALEADAASEGSPERESIGTVWANARFDLDAVSDFQTAPKPLQAQIHADGPPA